MDRRLVTIVSARLEARSSGPEAAQEPGLLKQQAERIVPMLATAGGRVRDGAATGIVAEFTSVVSAVQAAVDMQRAVDLLNVSLPAGQHLCLTVGINLWDVVVQPDHSADEGMLVAMRIQETAERGTIRVSETVCQHVRRHLLLSFEDAPHLDLAGDLHRIPTFVVRPSGLVRSGITSSAAYQASMVVLPFANVSDQPEQGYLSDGFTEEIISRLAKAESLYVVSPSIAFSYKSRPHNLTAVATELGVQYILRGTMRVTGEQVWISVQLDDGHINSKIMIKHYDCDFSGILQVQQLICEDVLHALRLKMPPGKSVEAAGRHVVDSEAYRFYLMGRSYFRSSHTRRHLRLARQMFQRALARDAGYAPAYAGLADCSAFLQEAGELSISVAEILTNSERALELDDTLAEAHASKGLALYGMCRYEEAETSFERAIALQPELFEAYFFYGRNCLNRAQFGRAADLFGQAAKLKLDDFRAFGLQSMSLLSLGQMEAARNAARASLVRAEAAVRERPDDADALSFGAGLLAFLGETRRTLAWAEQAAIIAPDDYYVQYNIACAYAGIGETEQAIDILTTIINRDIPESRIEYMMQDSDLDSIRDHPRYRKLMKDLLG